MRLLVIGSGAREHAMVHALRRSPEVRDIYAAPGNPGIAQAADLLSIGADDLPSLAEAASDLRIDLTLVGPEVEIDFRQSVVRCDGKEFAFSALGQVPQELIVAGGAENLVQSRLG